MNVYYRSKASWSEDVYSDHCGSSVSWDNHRTETSAQAVCEALEATGFGGRSEHFPLKTWVEKVTPVKVLSVRQPFATFICGLLKDEGFPIRLKDVENRTRKTSYRGRLYIHASLQVHERFKGHETGRCDVMYPKGVILGYVDLVDCVKKHDSSWFEGPWGWVLENPHRLENPIPAKGKLGIWNYELCEVVA